MAAPSTERSLDALLSEPRAATSSALKRAGGDIVVLGAGGKMGPTLAIMARRAAMAADGGATRRVVAVSRFRRPELARALREAGVDVIACDLLDRGAVAALPEAPNVLYMVGQKFGTHETPARTWMTNVVVPSICAERYASSRIVAFSTGNVYPLVSVAGPGSRETDPMGPVGEYACSCVGRERVFEYWAAAAGTRVAIVRLNYAIDLRYGVLTDLAARIVSGASIPLAMGYVNVIWQGDANRAALELLPLASSPPLVVNVTGTKHLSVRTLASELGKRLGRAPIFDGHEAPDALLSDASRMCELLGEPEMPLSTMLDWVAEWTAHGRPRHGTATHYDVRNGVF